MKAMLESTEKIVTLFINGAHVPARVWQGHTEGGIPFACFVTRVMVDKTEDTSQFERELEEQAEPRDNLKALPLSLVL